jgi:hypothetical protein
LNFVLYLEEEEEEEEEEDMSTITFTGNKYF